MSLNARSVELEKCMFGSCILQIHKTWVLGCLTAAMSATASLKLPEGDRENQQKKNVSDTEPPGRSPSWGWRRKRSCVSDVIEFPLRGAGICFRASAGTATMGPARPAPASREGNQHRSLQKALNKHPFRMPYFLTPAEKRERKR